MNRRIMLFAATAMVAAAPAFAQTQQQRAQAAQGQTGTQNQTAVPAASGARAEVVTGPEFMRMATMSDRFETASSRLAEQQSQNAQVKEFAAHMVRDHARTTTELSQLIQQVPGSGVAAETPLPQGRETKDSAGSGRITNAQGGPQHEGLDQAHAAQLQQLQCAMQNCLKMQVKRLLLFCQTLENAT